MRRPTGATCVFAPPLSSGVLPLTLLNLGCTRHSSSQLGSALICTRFQAAVACRGLSWHTSSVGVPGYSWYCPPGSGVLCAATVLWGEAPGRSEVTVSSLRWRLILYCQGQLFCFDAFRLPMGRPDGWGWSDREARLHG